MITLDAETLSLNGYDRHRAYSAAEFADVFAELPSCPVCGVPVTVQRIEVTLNEADLLANGRSYIPGMWECPRLCNPRTGQRFHGGWQLISGPEGQRLACSCGADLRDEQITAEVLREHNVT